MKFGLTSAVMFALALGACGGTSDPWLASARGAAGAPAGETTLLASYADYSLEDCEVRDPPEIVVVSQGRLGQISVAPSVELIDAPEDAAAFDDECDLQEAPATGVYYEAATGVAGLDTVVFRELRGGASPDVVHTMTVRVR